MQFALKSIGGEVASSGCYFQIRTPEHTFYSPFYPDQQTAIDAMRQLVLRLRNRKKTRIPIVPTADVFQLQLFGKKTIPVATGTLLVDKMEAIEALDKLLDAAPAFRFPLLYLELDENPEMISRVQDLDLQVGDEAYNWQLVKESTLVIEETRSRQSNRGLLGASVGVSPLSAVSPCSPLFNLLQPQLERDLPFFMGRKQDVEDLFALTRNHDLLLMYGPARVGKTSILQCGLSNRMKAVPGEFIVQPYRQGKTQELLADRIREELTKAGAVILPEGNDPKILLPALQEQLNKPVYLVFDQLERLFDKEVDEEEREAFFTWIQDLRADENISCRIILSLREGFLAPLADYEQQIPSLLNHRYRLQPLFRRSMVNVSLNIFDLFKKQGKLEVDEPEQLAEKLCDELANEDGEVSFQCLQIYLHQLQQEGCARSGGNTPLLNQELVDQMGGGRSVIDDYISKRLQELKAGLPTGDETPDPAVVEEMRLLEESREHCGCGKSQTIVPVAAAAGAGAVAPTSLRLRRLMWAVLAALAFGGITYWVLSSWVERQDPCFMAIKADTCEGYLNYLNEQGEKARCSADFAALLEERQCTVWQDYQLLRQNPTCGTFQAFYQKYRNTAVRTADVQQKLIEWECPMVRDTVQISVTDTIYQPTPGGYGATGRIPSGNTRPNAGPGCQDIKGTNFKKVGPLWFMTESLPGGPYSWEEALTACSSRGWRLPCVGEVDFLIDNIYRGKADRAYDMLTGAGECYLLNPAQAPNRRFDFWTGTEANDSNGWTFYFDTSTETIGRESNVSKERRLPCLCVQKDIDNHTTGLPPCYNKTVDRQ
ncbi:MAG: hypothetical protein AAFZ63_05335 [Bacteroidota bacterium]